MSGRKTHNVLPAASTHQVSPHREAPRRDSGPHRSPPHYPNLNPNLNPPSSLQIHESALRAKTRREVERQIQTQRAERRRAKSADLVRARKAAQPDFNPWLTEYMRCFSVRSR